MSDIVKVLYESFLMRDILGKVAPGFVSVYAGAAAFSIETTQYLPDERALWLLWVSALPILFLVGLAVQIASEFIGLHSASPRPRYVLLGIGNLIAKKMCWNNWTSVNRDFDRRLALLRNPPTGELGAEFQAQRERWVSLKEGSGNMATALLIAGTTLAWKSDTCFGEPVVLICVSLILYSSHFVHSHRQAVFEIRTLANIRDSSGVSYLADAQAMLDRIRAGPL